ncbi:UDP-glycosyltransferase UGT5-like [Macrobrachium nipponense]|uniref:UDP-glycosyltransferase UGT5-like n=1 Tax=Macrobrachium nipponense TaxID=159736 RepID=UPI0030C7F447
MKHVVLAIGLLLFGTFEFQGCDAYRILFIGPVGTRSHKNYYSSVIDALVERDHHVTFITPFPSSVARANVEEIAVPEGDFAKFDLNLFDEKYGVRMATSAMYFSLCDDTVRSPRVQDLVHQRYDLAFVSSICSDCYLWLVLPVEGWMLGFWSICVTYIVASSRGVERAASVQKTCRPLSTCTGMLQLTFANNVRELQSPARPYVPAVVSIGGIQCRPAEQLPQDLHEWVEGSGEEGLIYFSLGSIVKPSSLPEKNRQMFVRVFASLKQRVLWKWDQESMPDLPPNVMLKKWVPQQDILGHPKLRLFITQSGLYSTQESLYHGKPVLSLPVYADQLANARSIERQGWGKVIIWEEMTEDDLLDKITSIISSEGMLKVVRSKSLLMKDHAMSPKSLLVYWTEYVIRHRGATHLRCPLADMPWYTAYNVDVWLTLFALCVLLLWLILRLVIAVISCLLGRAKRKMD